MKKAKKYNHPAINEVASHSARLIELNHELEEKNRQLQQSEQARKSMFSNVTHDLRAPVAAIRGAAERLCTDGISDEERRKMLKIIDSRADVLDRLVGDLYFSMLVEQPEFSLVSSCLEIVPVLEEYFISMVGAGRLDDRDSRLNVPDGFSARTMIDPQHFLRVLDNLLLNAVRHTKMGDVIELGCQKNGDFIEIYLRDSGTGIPADDLPKLFNHTFTGEGPRTPGKSGSGLGLSIAKSIVEKHNGSIRCHSVYGQGATFIVSLPMV
jgi:signal transduction histidine kinase